MGRESVGVGRHLQRDPMTIPDAPLGRAIWIVRGDEPRPSRLVPALFIVACALSGGLLGAALFGGG